MTVAVTVRVPPSGEGSYGKRLTRQKPLDEITNEKPQGEMSVEDQEIAIDFVYFDLGNLLVAFDPEIACRNLAACCDITVEGAKAAIYESGLQDRFETGHVTGDEYARAVRERFGIDASQIADAQILDAISAMFTPIESMADTIDRVRRSGRAVGVLSNTCFAHWDWIQRQSYGVMQGDFQSVVLSCEVKSMKPDGGIYAFAEAEAARVTGKQAPAILFLDDKPENVAAAKQRGWHAVECFGGEQADRALDQFGFPVAV